MTDLHHATTFTIDGLRMSSLVAAGLFAGRGKPARMKRFSIGLLMSALLLAGCGGGSSTQAPVRAITQQQQHFAVPQALNQAVPPAPPNIIPAKPTDAQRAAVPPAPPNGVPTKPTGVRHTSDTSGSMVQFSTNLGNINVQLAPGSAPKNVANFLSYVNNGAYTNSIIHRSVHGFIFQGGGYTVSAGPTLNAIPTQPAVVNEFSLSNVRGTLAMAKVSNDPNSATSQWFFNEVNNAATLDAQNGGFTVIGQVADSASLAVMDAIAAVPVPSPGPLQAPFDQIPLINYTTGAAVQQSNLVIVSSVTPQASHLPFFSGEQALSNGVYYLALPSGNYFGYYAYLSDPRYIYHFDLGYEYTFDANDGNSGIYFYDFASGHFFYTSPSFPFPYLYDFSLGSVVYYYPDTANAGHYTSSPRYFYEFKTGTIITE